MARCVLALVMLLVSLYPALALAAKPLPDLVVTSLTAPTSAAPGETISIIYTVQNIGGGNASGSTLRATLSGPSIQTLLGSASVPALQKGRSRTSALSGTIPASLVSGSYTVMLMADVNQQIAESNEENNTRSVPITISAAGPGEALLTWTPNPEPDITGYTASYGTASRTYTMQEDAGLVTSYRVAPLLSGETYYFAVSAHRLDGIESEFSNEARKTMP